MPKSSLLGDLHISVPNWTNVKTGSDHWYVSYNNHDYDIYGSDTTALVLGQGEYFLILNGDHRKGLQAAIDAKDGGATSGLKRCLAYVRANKESLNKISDSLV